MGASAADSVTDSFGRTWDVDNLVVADGGVFTSNAHKNPDPDHHGAGLAQHGPVWPSA